MRESEDLRRDGIASKCIDKINHLCLPTRGLGYLWIIQLLNDS